MAILLREIFSSGAVECFLELDLLTGVLLLLLLCAQKNKIYPFWIWALLLVGYMKKKLPKYLLIYLIRFYRFFISPFFPGTCRFYPTCSSFAIEAIEKHGVISGVCLAIMRLFRCHPFGRYAGHDTRP